MSWIHAVAATLLVLGSLAVFAFLRLVDALDGAETLAPEAAVPARPVTRTARPALAAARVVVVEPEPATYRRAA